MRWLGKIGVLSYFYAKKVMKSLLKLGERILQLGVRREARLLHFGH